MRVIGVIDALAGMAVRAVGGHRERYQPMPAIDALATRRGDAVALARAYIERLGIIEIYLADLDAISGQPPQTTLTSDIAALGATLWVDCAVTSPTHAQAARTLGATRVVVALETLPAYDVLGEVAAALDPQTVAFSLDLREGRVVTSPRGS